MCGVYGNNIGRNTLRTPSPAAYGPRKRVGNACGTTRAQSYVAVRRDVVVAAIHRDDSVVRKPFEGEHLRTTHERTASGTIFSRAEGS